MLVVLFNFVVYEGMFDKFGENVYHVLHFK